MKQLDSIGESIKTCRKDKGLTQPQLAKIIGVSHAAISFYENDVNIPNVKICWAIADTESIR